MKTQHTTQSFDAVRFMRRQRRRMSKMLCLMNTEQIVDYFTHRAQAGS